MITMGIDSGMENVKVAVLEGKNLLSHVTFPIATDTVSDVVNKSMKIALEQASVHSPKILGIGITGSSAEYVPEIDNNFRLSLACAKGIEWVSPNIKTVISIGAESFLVFNCQNGKPIRVERNDVCAAGTGRYLQKVAQLLNLDPSEMGHITGDEGQDNLTVGSICAVFAETEIISLIHAKKKPQDILAGVYNGVGSRILPLISKVKLEEKVAVIGGVAKNPGVIKAIEKRLNTGVVVPQNPEIIGAVGVALLIQDRLKEV